MINLLSYGYVDLKEVDLFMNEQVVSYLCQPPCGRISNWDVFVSLIKTQRITVLIPDESRELDKDNPIFSVAFDHAQNRYCRRLDQLLVSQQACRQRKTPPHDRNSFAELFHAILTGKHKEWRKRRQFRGITHDNRKRFFVSHDRWDRLSTAIESFVFVSGWRHIVKPTGESPLQLK